MEGRVNDVTAAYFFRAHRSEQEGQTVILHGAFKLRNTTDRIL